MKLYKSLNHMCRMHINGASGRDAIDRGRSALGWGRAVQRVIFKCVCDFGERMQAIICTFRAAAEEAEMRTIKG